MQQRESFDEAGASGVPRKGEPLMETPISNAHNIEFKDHRNIDNPQSVCSPTADNNLMWNSTVKHSRAQPEMSIHLREGIDIIPKAGGEIPYLITFTNVDLDEFFKE